MAAIPIEWKLSVKGSGEVKSELDQLSAAFNRAKASGGNYGKEQRALSSAVNRRINEDRLQNRLLLAQHPNLLKVTRGLSTITSVSRGLLSVYNAVNIMKIKDNTLDLETIEIKKQIRDNTEAINEEMKKSIPNWDKINELTYDNNELLGILKDKQQAIISQKWEDMVNGALAAVTAIGTVFNGLMQNKTFAAAVARAGGFFGGVFGGAFTWMVNIIAKAGLWMASALGVGSPVSKAAYVHGAANGRIFGLGFVGGVIQGVLTGLAATAIWDIISEKLSGTSQLKKTTGKSASEVLKETTGIDVIGHPSVPSKTPAEIMGQPTDHVSSWQPVLDLFTKTIPEALVSAKDGFFNMFKGTTELTNQFGSNLVAGVNQIFGELINSMNKAIASYNKAAKKMGRSTISSLSFTPSTFTPVPDIKAANGFSGIVNSPTMFLAGEAGPESVQITPGGRQSQGNVIIVNVAGSVITEKQLAYKIDQIQKQNLKSRGFTGY